MKKAFVVIDIQNDITKNYKDIIDGINTAIDWAVTKGMPVVYIKHNNLSAGTRTFKPDTLGAELVLTPFIHDSGIEEFYITGADATACVKSTCYNMTKSGYTVHVFSDCVTSYDQKKIGEMLEYYASKGCIVEKLSDVM